MICVANWPRPRRRVFSTLLRARAMENLCYAIGVNRVGEDPQGLFYTEDSAILNARGETLAEAKENQEEILLTTWGKEVPLGLKLCFPLLVEKEKHIVDFSLTPLCKVASCSDLIL